MPLKLNLKKEQKIIINGAVLENKSDRSLSLALLNDAVILRDRDILTAEEASTPAARVYYSLQCAYLFKEKRIRYVAEAKVFIEDFMVAVPSSKKICEKVLSKIEDEDFYGALRDARKLIDVEAKVLEPLPETETD
ncbi:flagellar biosynthesis repressor FlbT [Terasakiella sp.]|uniref:flagellar biosynthesis repressor FlbT n=1 Tax=Terasakiella sp. TaxID=2034861 RepID=UPI003AA88F0B